MQVYNKKDNQKMGAYLWKIIHIFAENQHLVDLNPVGKIDPAFTITIYYKAYYNKATIQLMFN